MPFSTQGAQAGRSLSPRSQTTPHSYPKDSDALTSKFGKTCELENTKAMAMIIIAIKSEGIFGGLNEKSLSVRTSGVSILSRILSIGIKYGTNI